MPKRVCVNCEVEFKPEENGVLVIEMFQENAKPYKLWIADLLKCPVCGFKIVAGFGINPIAHHFEKHMNQVIEDYKQKGKTIIYDFERKV